MKSTFVLLNSILNGKQEITLFIASSKNYPELPDKELYNYLLKEPEKNFYVDDEETVGLNEVS